MFTVLPYTVLTAGASTDLDMTFVSDAEFTGINNHARFTEEYQLLAAYVGGVTVTRANVQTPQYNAYSRFNLWPLNRSLNIPNPPQTMWLDKTPVMLPRFEEITVKVTTTGVAEQDNVFLWLAKAPWNVNLPPSQIPFPLVARATSAVTLIANAWSALTALTFEQTLKGGTYSVIGASCQCANGQLFRLVFPRSFTAGTRKMRPGWLCNQALGDQDEARVRENPFCLGEWGRFWSVEMPQLEVYGSAAGAQTAELRLWLAKLSDTDAGLP
jgi:hypothetical protein